MEVPVPAWMAPPVRVTSSRVSRLPVSTASINPPVLSMVTLSSRRLPPLLARKVPLLLPPARIQNGSVLTLASTRPATWL